MEAAEEDIANARDEDTRALLHKRAAGRCIKSMCCKEPVGHRTAPITKNAKSRGLWLNGSGWASGIDRLSPSQQCEPSCSVTPLTWHTASDLNHYCLQDSGGKDFGTQTQ